MRITFCAALAATMVLAACGEKPKAAAPTPEAAAAGNAAPIGPLTPCPTCKLFEVGMVTTDKGNYFEPKDIDAHEGDVVRFKLVVGVHNVSFPADSNPGKSGLPAATVLLQLPGQTTDVLLNFGTGEFRFQCDAHAALGMTGRIKVEPKKG
jgi:plastocyanin